MKTTFLITVIVALGLNMTFASENLPKKPILNVVETSYQMLLTQPENNLVVFTLYKEQGDLFKVKVYDVRGNRLFTKRIKRNNKSKTSFDLSELPIGSYFVKVERNKEELYSRQIDKK